MDTDDRAAFLREYSSDDAIARYVTKTAGKGIQYNLTHAYGQVYAEIIDRILAGGVERSPFRVLEYGCGGGMNLIWILRMLMSRKLALIEAIGSDFSQPLIAAAQKEKEKLPSPYDGADLKFVVAANETLLEDLSRSLVRPRELLAGSFDWVIGVNTFRYVLRLQKESECSSDIATLLRPGGYSVMIDMNTKFPVFRSRFQDRRMKTKSQYWLPSLEEYAAAFETAGLEVVKKWNFCWIPHSAGNLMLAVMRSLTPILDRLAPGFSMRSLVVAQKPR